MITSRNVRYFYVLLLILSPLIARSYYDFSKNAYRGSNDFSCLQNNVNINFGEFILDTTIVTSPVVSILVMSDIAFDGTNYFVVWLDNRYDLPYFSIFGARINRDGIVIDTGGIPISTICSIKYFPAVTYGGSYFLVVWHDDRNVSTDFDIYGARVTSDGIVLDPQGIPICTQSAPQFDPNAAFDGNNFFVVWTDARLGNGDLYGTRLSPSGTVLDPQGIPISTAPRMQGDVEIAFDGSNYLITWDDERNFPTNDFDVYGARVTPGGTVLDTSGIPICTVSGGQGPSAIAYDGTNYLVIWNDARVHSDSSDIYGARLNPQGIVLDTNGFFIGNADNWVSWFISVAFDGTNYLAVWQDYSDTTGFDIYGARVNPSGVVVDTIKIPIARRIGSEDSPCVAFDGMNYLVAWYGAADSIPFAAIFYRRISPAGAMLDSSEKILSIQASSQDYPAAAWGGSSYFVVWDDERGNSFENLIMKDLYGIRVSPTGAILDSQSILIASGNYYQIFPAIAFDGTNYLVTYDSGALGIYDIYGVRINQSGVILDTVKIPICVNYFTQRYSTLAFDGANYLSLWQDERNGSSNFDIYGARISPAGTVLDTIPLEICTAPTNQQYPKVTYGTTNYFAVWQDSRNGSINIYGTRINTVGIVLDTSGIIISATGYNQNYPALAFDGLNYLVVWQDDLGGPFDICGARVSQTGTILDTNAIIICAAPGNQESPTVAFDGTNYVVMWQDSRFGNYQENLYGAKVSPAGTVIDSFVVASQPGRQILPALTRGNGNQVLVAYTGWTDSINQHSAQTMRIWGKLYPPYGIAEGRQYKPGSNHINIDLFPNPMKNVTNLYYNLSYDTWVKITVYDVTGRLVKGIVNKQQKKGDYQAILNLSDLSQGVYFLRSDFNGYTAIKKIILIK